MKVAIIPARGGSKRIPKKNIRKFYGKPIIAYSIEEAIKSKLFDKVIVSTDCKDIADIAISYGAEVPFFRSKKLADDITGTISVISDAITNIKSFGWKVDKVCCIYATSPFLESKYLTSGLNLLEKKQADYIFSATSFPFPIQRAIKLEGEKVSMFFPYYEKERSQDLEESYHDAGQFYWGSSDAFLNQKPIFSSNSYAIYLPRIKVHDIDTIEDWEVAEKIYQTLYGK